MSESQNSGEEEERGNSQYPPIGGTGSTRKVRNYQKVPEQLK